MITWNYSTNEDKRRSYRVLPDGIYVVQIERAVEMVSSSGNPMIKMDLRVLRDKNNTKVDTKATVRNNVTFSKWHAKLVNKVLSDIYSSFDIPEGNLEAKTWVGKVGVAQLEQDEFNGNPYNRVAYFLTKQQQLKLGISVEEPDEAVVEEEDEEEEYYSSLRPHRKSAFEYLRRN